MLETPHVLVGVAIATKIPNPIISIPLALASHFVLEGLPHWNPHLYTETEKYGQPTRKSTLFTAVDSSIALTTGSLIAFSHLPDLAFAFTIFFSAFAAVLPDVIEAPYLYLKYRKPWLKKYILWQRSIQADAQPFWGLFTQILIIIAALLSLNILRF